MEDEGGLSSVIPAIQNLKKFHLNDPNKIQDGKLIADEFKIHNQEQMQSLQANETGNSSLNEPEQVSILGDEDSHHSSVNSSSIHSNSNVTANHQNNENVPSITVNNPQENESNFISNSNANYNISRSADFPSNLYKNYGTKNLEESNISDNYGNEDEPRKHVTKSISIFASFAQYGDQLVDLEKYKVLEVLHNARFQKLKYLKEEEIQAKTELMQAKKDLKHAKGEIKQLSFALQGLKKLTQENDVLKRKLDAEEKLSAEMEAKQSEQMQSLQANETGNSSLNDPEQVSILGDEDSHHSSVNNSSIHSNSNVTANHQNNENAPSITVNNPQENESNSISNSNANYNISRSADFSSNLYKNYGTKNLEESNISDNYGNEDEPRKHVTKSISICASCAQYRDQPVDLEEYKMLEVLHNVRIRQLKYLKEEVIQAETELKQVKKDLKHAKGEIEQLTFDLQGLQKLTQENYVLKRKLDALKEKLSAEMEAKQSLLHQWRLGTDVRSTKMNATTTA